MCVRGPPIESGHPPGRKLAALGHASRSHTVVMAPGRDLLLLIAIDSTPVGHYGCANVRHGPTSRVGICKVTKKEIAKWIAEDLGLTQLQAKDIVQRTLDAVIQTLVTDGRIELRNVGVFEVRRRASWKARNPRTGETLIAPARNVVTFKPGRQMEDRVGGMVVERNPQAAREDATDHPSSGSSPKPKKKVSSNPE
jgi:integration host factor subunit beta